MIKCLNLFTVWSFVTLLLSTNVFGADADGPHGLVVSEQRLEFGNVSKGTLQEKTFTLENQGEKTVKVALDVTCQCIQIRSEKSLTLEPGSKKTVTVGVNTISFSGQRDVSVRILASTNRRDTGEMLVGVSVNISSEFLFEPTAVRFDGVYVGDVEKRVVKFTYSGTTPDEIEFLSQTTKDYISVSIERTKPTATADGRWLTSGRINVIVNKLVPTGNLREKLIIVAKEKDRTNTGSIEVLGKILDEDGFVEINPKSVVLRVKKGEEIRRYPVILNSTNAFKIKGVAETDVDGKRLQTTEKRMTVLGDAVDMGELKRVHKLYITLNEKFELLSENMPKAEYKGFVSFEVEYENKDIDSVPQKIPYTLVFE